TMITLEDNGIGIPAELGNKTFEMFIKGTEKSEGAGLGMYEAKVIVEERFGGKIWLKSFGTSELTQIGIILPFMDE
ncbi:MAG: ATP-binding protein, partial [Flammeovirgaceae bacterium]